MAPPVDEVAFLSTMDSGGSASAWRVVVKEAGQVWAPKEKCRLVPLKQATDDGWTHRLYVPRWLAEKDAKLSAVLARDAEDKPPAPRPGGPRHDFQTRPRADTGYGSGPTAEQLYVERKMARLSEADAAGLLSISWDTYRDLELGRRNFAHEGALARALRLFAHEGEQRVRRDSSERDGLPPPAALL